MKRSANISVVIPCFNAASTLSDAIESALRESDVEVDVIVVDDGSSDNSLALARRYEPHIRIFTGPNRGVSAARNRGITESNSEWIIFLDSDDVLVHGTLTSRLDVAKRAHCDVIICDWEDFSSEGSHSIKGPVHSPNMAALAVDPEIACATDFYVRPAALMYRRTLVERIGGFREDLLLIEDARFLFDAACQGASFQHSPHLGARVRIVQSSLSRSDPGRFWQYVLLNGKQIEMLWRARGALSSKQVDALFRIFESASRGLFATARPEYLEAVESQRMLGKQLTRHARFTPHLARAFGLRRAQRLLRLFGQ